MLKFWPKPFKSLVYISIVFGVLSGASVVQGADLRDGLIALQTEHFQEATREFHLLWREDHDPKAAFMLGVMAENGFGNPPDILVALSWYQKAAKSGLASAYYNIGLIYQFGKTVDINPQKAFLNLSQAAERGHAKAQNNLASLYNSGRGVQKSKVEAWKWFNLAARSLEGEAADLARKNAQSVAQKMSGAELTAAKQKTALWEKAP